MNVYWRFLKFDYKFQAILFIINTLLILASLSVSLGMIYLVLLLQIFIGFYQVVVSGLVNLIQPSLDDRVKRIRKIHFWGGINYVVGLISLSNWGGDFVFLFIFFLIIPQIIAYGYFYLTVKDYTSRMKYLNTRPTIFAY